MMYDDNRTAGGIAAQKMAQAEKAARDFGPEPMAVDRPDREFDNFVMVEHEQMASATSLMRRIEDLADRLLGASPVAEASNSAATKPMRAGHFGSLVDAHETRDSIYRRMGDALGRIEKVL